MNTDALKRWREQHPEGAPHGPPRNAWQKWEDHDTRKTAIDAHCWQCMGGSESYVTGVRDAIRECAAGPDSIQPCPLHAWRPYR